MSAAEAALISLSLKPRDNIPTPSGTATDPANKGYWIWYTVVAPGVTPPTNPKDLHESFYTKRKKDVIEFDFNDSGKTTYFAVQIENEGKKGSWGPLVSVLIP